MKKGSQFLVSAAVLLLIMSFTLKKKEMYSNIKNTSCDTIIYFKEQIMPILQDKCVSCHNTQNKKHNIALDTYDNIIKTIEVEEGENELSEVIVRNSMPPGSHQKLTPEEKAIVLTWIKQGMPNNSSDTTSSTPSTYTLVYSTEAKQLIDNYCIGCHNANKQAAGYDLTNSETVLEMAKSGLLMKVITHAEGVRGMPLRGDKIPESEIAVIKNWIDSSSK